MAAPSSRKNIAQPIGSILFVVGVLLTLTLAILAIWADTEAIFYGFQPLGENRLNTVDCPVLFTPNAPGLITATFKNNAKKAINLGIHSSFSGPMMTRQDEKLLIEAGETKTKTWEVTQANVVMHYFAFAQIGHYAALSIPFYYKTCGMVFVNVPVLNGDQLFALWFLLGMAGLVFGIILWSLSSQPLEGKRFKMYQAMRFLAIAVLLCMLVALQGWWLTGILLIVGTLLAIASMLAWRFVSSST